MGKSLAIVSGYWDPSQLLEEGRPSNTDILAVDLPAMQACRSSAIPFLNPGDFYAPEEFRLTFRRVIRELEVLFENLDRKYADEVSYPHALKSNVYPFLCYFADLHYLTGLARAINQRYFDRRIVVAGSDGIRVDRVRVPMDCDIFGNQLFTKRDAIIYNLRHLSKLLGSPPIVQVSQSKEDRLGQSVFAHLRRRYGYLLWPDNWDMLLEKLRVRLGVSVTSPNRQKIIWSIQDGYDVAALKKYMPDFTFLNPKAGLEKDVPCNAIDPIYQEAVQVLSELYPEWASEIEELLEKYHKGVICRLAIVAEEIARQVETDQPQCALYSIGAIIPLEALYAWVLNQRNVPIYFFQHGGSNFYFNAPLNNCIEFNTDIDQITFCISKLEGDLRRQKNSNLRIIPTGSVKLFEWHEANKKRHRLPGNGRILYVQGRYPSEVWKNLFCTEGEEVIFTKHEQFFDLAAKYDLPLDIKLFPGTVKRYAPYFQRFIKRFGIARACLLYDVPAEVIAPQYSLIIMECLGSALNVFFMALDRPILYYLAERDMINPAIADDFYRRNYVAHNRAELDEILCHYKQGALVSKCSPEFVDKYAYPLRSGNPGIRVAQVLG